MTYFTLLYAFLAVGTTLAQEGNKPPVFTGIPESLFVAEDSALVYVLRAEDPDSGNRLNFNMQHPGLPDRWLALVNDTLRGVPANEDVGSLQVQVTVSDSEYSDTAFITVVVRNVNDPPVARIVSIVTAGGAAYVDLDVEDEDGTLAETQFCYSLFLAGVEKSRSVFTAVSAFEVYPLINGNYRLEVRARDKHGLIQEGVTHGGFSIRGVDKLSLESGVWRLAGIPMSSLNLSEAGDGVQVLRWENNHPDSALRNPYISGDSLKRLEAGKGYWLKSEKQIAIGLMESRLNRNALVVELQGKGLGWNQVGNPFPYPLDMFGSGFTFWEWDPAAADIRDAGGLLKPWGAYWVHAEHDTTLTLHAKPCFNRSPPARHVFYRGPQNWVGQLILEAGGYSDRSNFFGVKPLAKAAAGANQPEPPKMGRHISLFFPDRITASTERRYTTDFRAVIDPEEEWFEFGVMSEKSGLRTARLGLEGMEALRRIGYTTFLLDKNEARELKNDSIIEVPLSAQPRYYFIVVTGDSEFKQRISGEFNLAQHDPNQVRQGAAFQFHLPYRFDPNGKKLAEKYTVSLKCHTMKGRLLTTIFKKILPEGLHTFYWRRSVRVPSGSYLFRLQAGSFQATKKVLVWR